MSVPVLRPDRIPLRRPGVVFRIHAEMVVHTSQRVLVRTRAVALPFDDLDFAIRGGDRATVIPDETFDSRCPTVLLLAGESPGDYWLVARQRITGTVVGETRFTVIDECAGVQSKRQGADQVDTHLTRGPCCELSSGDAVSAA